MKIPCIRRPATACLLKAVRNPPASAAANAEGLTRYKPFPNPPLLYTLTQFTEKYLFPHKLKEIVQNSTISFLSFVCIHYKAEDDKYQAISTFFLTFLLIFYTELFLLTEVISQPGLRQLQLNQISTNRRNAVFFCQILLVFVLYMLHNSDIVYQGGGCT